MIAIDTQILVYAHRADSPWHGRARPRIGELAASGVRWAIPMHCIVEFFTAVTRPNYYLPASTFGQATAQIDAWLEAPSVSILSEDAQTWSTLRNLLAAGAIVGPKAYDARIAAVCLQHGVTELWTHDRDFSRFPGLRVRNPLIDIHPTRASEPRAVYQTSAKSKQATAAGKRRRSRR